MTEQDRWKRIGVLGDVHAQDARVEAALEFFGPRVDAVLCVGDIADGDGDLDRTCKLLREGGVVAVAGNHERWFLTGEMREVPNATMDATPQTRAYLAGLPRTLGFDTDLGPLLVCHGVGDDDEAELFAQTSGYSLRTALDAMEGFEETRLLVGGHTHQPMVRRIGECWFINAGTLRPGEGECLLEIDLELREARFFSWDGATVGELTSVHSLRVDGDA